MKKYSKHFYNKIFISNVIFILIITTICLCIVYYWSFYHFSKIFEDRVIDEYTLRQFNSLGVENEWILGVTTNSIDVLDMTYGEEIRKHIEQKALNQHNIYKLYKEKIDSKDLIYIISLDVKNGEYLYKYSVIKNIYAGIFPKIVITFVILSCFIIFISYIYINFISKQFYTNIDKLKNYAYKLENLDLNIEPLQIVSNDENITSLANTFKNMHLRLNEKDKLQKNTLQYISHEMKTPIMIIESYTIAIKDNMFPKETLENSLDIILTQTERMKLKVDSLLKFVTLSTKDLQKENINLFNLFNIILNNYNFKFNEVKNFKFIVEKNIYISADKEKIQILIENLIENQLKYFDFTIIIRVFKYKDKVIMLFFNDGEKISIEIKKRIFTPFSKGYNGSNGLGLYICKTILLQHNKNIKLIDTKYGVLFQIIM